jgi:hypothetical protein
MKENIKNFVKAFFGPTPKGWTKLRNWAIGVVSLALTVLGLQKFGVSVPDIVLNVASYIVAVGTVLGFTAQSQTKGVINDETEKDA